MKTDLIAYWLDEEEEAEEKPKKYKWRKATPWNTKQIAWERPCKKCGKSFKTSRAVADCDVCRNGGGK